MTSASSEPQEPAQGSSTDGDAVATPRVAARPPLPRRATEPVVRRTPLTPPGESYVQEPSRHERVTSPIEPSSRPRASQSTADYVWRLVITSVVVVLVGLAAVVSAAVLLGVMNVLPLVGMFTAVLTFLAGLLVPSPLQGAARTISSRLRDASGGEE